MRARESQTEGDWLKNATIGKRLAATMKGRWAQKALAIVAIQNLTDERTFN